MCRRRRAMIMNRMVRRVPPRQASRSRFVAQSHPMLVFRTLWSERITSPAIALTIPTRYARQRVDPEAPRRRLERLCSGSERMVGQAAPRRLAGGLVDADGSRRSEARSKASMTTFDKREEGFEKQFARDEELKFKASARRNKLFGLWAAEKLGLSGAQAEAYAKEVVMADFEEPGDHDVFRKVRKDFDAKGLEQSDHQIRRTMDELMAKAIAEIKVSG